MKKLMSMERIAIFQAFDDAHIGQGDRMRALVAAGFSTAETARITGVCRYTVWTRVVRESHTPTSLAALGVAQAAMEEVLSQNAQ